MLCTPKFRVRRVGQRATGSLTPAQVAAVYQLPQVKVTRQPVIGILELGGGYRDADNAAAFQDMFQPTPVISNVSVAGAGNTPGGAADGEVALDIQVAGGVCQWMARQCKIVVAWVPNDGGTHFAAGINALVAAGVDTISISWGGPENEWTSTDRATVGAAIDGADAAGVPVFVASGDAGSSDGEGGVNVDFPASYPGSIGCGGTTFGSAQETVWNDGRGDGTGGGFSTYFVRPDWQTQSFPGATMLRGVPDVSGLADPSGPGWRIVLQGAVQAMGGTSAVAPLWAGIVAACKASGFSGHQLASLLYGTPAAMRDIVTGNNGAYTAAPGWDPCTGLGSPNGPALVSLLINGGTGAAPPASPPAASPPTSPPPSVSPPTLAQAQAAAVQGVEDAAAIHSPFFASIIRLSEPDVRSRLAALWQSSSPSDQTQGESMTEETKLSPRIALATIFALIAQLLPLIEQILTAVQPTSPSSGVPSSPGLVASVETPALRERLQSLRDTAREASPNACRGYCAREKRPRDSVSTTSTATPATISTDLTNLQAAQAMLVNDQTSLSTAQASFTSAQSAVTAAQSSVATDQATVAGLVKQAIADIATVYGPPAA